VPAACQCHELPAWVSYGQALAVPILALAVAGFGAYIAWRQKEIASEKLRNDEFYRQYEKRFEVYRSTREFLAAAFLNGIDDDAIRAYTLRTLDSQFIFDEAMYAYLKEVRVHVSSWHSAKVHMGQSSGDEAAEFRRIRDEHMAWIMAQGDERTGFATHFAPFLKPRS